MVHYAYHIEDYFSKFLFGNFLFVEYSNRGETEWVS